MEKGTRESRSKADIIDAIDARLEPPASRAARVWEVLRREGFTDWDVVCFAAEALGFLSPAYPWLREDAKRLAILVYQAHYFASEHSVAKSDTRGESQIDSTRSATQSDSARRSGNPSRSALHVRDNRDKPNSQTGQTACGSDGGASNSKDGTGNVHDSKRDNESAR